jgi:hypothetical protein
VIDIVAEHIKRRNNHVIRAHRVRLQRVRAIQANRFRRNATINNNLKEEFKKNTQF